MRDSFKYLATGLLIILGVLGVVGICAVVNSSPSLADDKIKDEYLPVFSQNRILFPEYCGESGGGGCSPYASGDYAAVMNAKNADKSFFNGSGDVPSMQWSPNADSMKQLLETYGDLAYQLGRAAGVPWIAVLAQAHFEDPQSVCGHNNFWGNGCDPSHAYLGGADQVIGEAKNLGEGFSKYGETAHNGYYEEALTKTDPLEYLRALEGTWIGTGDSYAIEGHVKALEEYIKTPEGKAIVETFGSYTGNSTACGSSSSSSTASSGDAKVSAEGLTEEMAAYLLARYALDEGGDSSSYASDWWINDGHSNFQCTAFSAWFVNKFTKQSLTGRNFTGSGAVSVAVSQSNGSVSYEPEVFSLFSVPGHTGIVVGKKDDGTIITANYNGHFNGGSCNCLPISTEEFSNFKPEDAYYYSGGTWNDYSYPFGVDHGYGLGGSPTFLKLDVDLDLLSSYLDGAISVGGGSDSKYCKGSSSSSVGNGDILKAVEEVMELANRNGSTYTGRGGHGGEEQVKAMLDGAPVNVDCSGFSTLVLYKAFGVYAEHSSGDLLKGIMPEQFKEISRSEVRPGDIFAFHSGSGISGGHVGIVMEVNNGKITKVAEAGCSEGLACDAGGPSATNTNLGYTTTGYSINYTNSDAGHFYRFEEKN